MDEKEKLQGVRGFQEQETEGVSPWMFSLLDELGQDRNGPRWTYSFEDFRLKLSKGRNRFGMYAFCDATWPRLEPEAGKSTLRDQTQHRQHNSQEREKI